MSFIRLSSNPAYTPAAVAPTEAAHVLRQLVAHPAHRYLKTLPEPEASMFARALGHRQVQDAYLVRVAARHRSRLVTFDRRVTVQARSADSVHVIGG